MAQIQPTGGIPQPQGPGEDPLLYYTRLFVRFLQLVFGTFDTGSYHWSESPETTEILIAGQSGETREVAESNPAIIVSRGAISYTNLTMDQLRSYDPATGKRTHTVLAVGSVVYNCCSSVELEAQRLASICDYATRTLKRTLMKAGIHRVGEEITISPESPPGAIVKGDPKEVNVVSVNVPFYFQQTWTVEPINKVLLKDLIVTLRSDINYPDQGATVINAPAINGKPLTFSKIVSLTSGIKVARQTTPKPRK